MPSAAAIRYHLKGRISAVATGRGKKRAAHRAVRGDRELGRAHSDTPAERRSQPVAGTGAPAPAITASAAGNASAAGI